MINQSLKEKGHNRESSDYHVMPIKIYDHEDTMGTFIAPFHWHNELEILYVEEGELLIHTNGTAHIAKAGELYFINCQDIHQISAQTLKSKHTAIVFNPLLLRFEWFDPTVAQFINPIIYQKSKFLFHINDHPHILAKLVYEFKFIMDSYRNELPSWPLMAKAALLKIVALLYEHDLIVKIQTMVKESDDKTLLAKTVMSYIHANYMKKITIEDLANIVNLSPQYFCKLFKHMFGKTAIEYINDYRIEKACHLLKQTDDKIIDIAFAVGFDNFSYFIRKFKATKDLTPSVYRNTA